MCRATQSPPAAFAARALCALRGERLSGRAGLARRPWRTWPTASQQGAGLVMFGGWESFFGRLGEYHQSPLADVLPVVMRASDDRRNCAQPCLVEQDGRHPILDGLPWDQPPGIGGFNAVDGQARRADAADFSAVFRASNAAAVSSFTRGDESPLLVVGQHGRGRTAALATDVAPHWVGGLVDWGDRRVVQEVAGERDRGRQLVRPVLPQSAGLDGKTGRSRDKALPAATRGVRNAQSRAIERNSIMLHGNAIIGQSGGPTSVINASLCGIIQQCLAQKAIGKTLGMRFGIEGFMRGDVIDLGREAPADDRGPAHHAQFGAGKLPPQAPGRRLPANPRNAQAARHPLLLPHRRQRHDGHDPSRRGVLPRARLRIDRRGRAEDGRQRPVRHRPHARLRQCGPLRGPFGETGRHVGPRHAARRSVRDFSDGGPLGRLAAGGRRVGQGRPRTTPRTSFCCPSGPSTATASWPT